MYFQHNTFPGFSGYCPGSLHGCCTQSRLSAHLVRGWRSFCRRGEEEVFDDLPLEEEWKHGLKQLVVVAARIQVETDSLEDTEQVLVHDLGMDRSEERRVGKECRS